jgi:ribokinase
VSILVSGLINIETTLRVDAFPIEYTPVRYPFYGVNSTVSGVGYNVAKALTTLGNEVSFFSMIGRDFAGTLVYGELQRDGIPGNGVLDTLEHTPQSVILFDGQGRRQINVDLKDIQERDFPQERFDAALRGCSIAALCNINFSRPMLQKARKAGKLVATDVHAISDLDDDYNRDFMQFADILFMSHERLPCSSEEWINRASSRYGNEIIVIGLGVDGALIYVKSDRLTERIPAIRTGPVVNTIGAGDALFSCFLHAYNKTRNPQEAIRKAIVFASHKIGATGAADGFLDEAQLNAQYEATTVGKNRQ